MDEGMYLQPSHLPTYIERSVMLVLIEANGIKINDNVRLLRHSTRCGVETLTFSSRHLTVGW